MMNYCYAETLQKFMKSEESFWIKEIKDNFWKVCGEEASLSQIKSWKDCYRVLKEQLRELEKSNPKLYIIFEYVLRYTSKKRPDVLLVGEQNLVILEFKRKVEELLEDRLQVEEYGRKLYKYHTGCQRMKSIVPALVLSSDEDFSTYKAGIATILSNKHVFELVDCLKNVEPLKDPVAWLNSPYAETPTVVEYAKAKKSKIILPEYEVVRKAGIKDAEVCLHDQIVKAYQEKKHIVAFVNGVPGAGKTLLGVDLAYDTYQSEKGIHSVFLSGNGPLVAVLQDALDDHFIQNIHVYLDQYTEDGAIDFGGNVCVFDEGQRIWTAEQRKKKNKKRSEMSEAALFIEMLDARVDWNFLLVLIGDGQEINAGEEDGLNLWKEAVAHSKYQWEILCPPSMDSIFQNFRCIKDDRREKLTLVNSLRSNGSSLYSTAVNYMIDEEITKAKICFMKSKKLYPMYITRDLNKAKNLCKRKYAGITDKRYGMIASSQSIILPKYGVDNTYANTKQTRVFPAKWYNAPVDSNLSCCALTKPVTEYGCQGLELDMPIVCWESDMIWNGETWNIIASGKNGQYQPKGWKRQYCLNSYRVLLTRGRDGLIVYIPKESKLDKTYMLLINLGFEEIDQT